MARVAINAIAKPADGFDLVNGSGFTVMATGADNGVELAGASAIYMRNPTGGAAAYTVISAQAPQYARQGITVPDKTVTVPANATTVYWLNASNNQSGKVFVDCDVAGEIIGIQ